MFEGIGDVIVFDVRIQRDLMTGNQADLAKANQEVNAKVKKIIAKIKSGYATLKFLATDTDTHHMLEQFAEDYYHSMSKLMLLKDVANFTGGLIPAIIIGLITKNPEALGASMAATLGPMIEKAGGIIEEIVTLLKELKLCKTVEGADVDAVHVVKTEKILPGPEVPEYHLNNFSEKAVSNRKIEDEVFYKYHGESNRLGKTHNYVTKKKYNSISELRDDLAILEEWGIKIDRVTTFKPPAGTWISEGTAAEQTGFTGEHKAGGGYQGLIDINNLPKSSIIGTEILPEEFNK